MAKIHQCLGHPNKVTLMRMLTLAGAPKEIIELAGRYECPIGAQVNALSRYPKEMHLDLKYIYIYIYDVENKVHIALNLVDDGTSFHVACLLRNRKADYVTRNFFDVCTPCMIHQRHSF